MTMWGAFRVQCAIPDCPQGDIIFSSQRGGEIHLWLEHNISTKRYKEFLIYVEKIPRRTKESAFEEWWATQNRGADVETAKREAQYAFYAGWDNRIRRKP